jgi:hypothetical protein
MDSEIKQLLEKDLAMDEENNKILKKIVFSNRLSLTLSVIKWTAIIVSFLGITYWIGPQLETLLSTYKSLLN